MLYWHFIHIYVLHMSNVHQYIWWQVGVRWFFYENWIICTFCAFGVIYGFGEKSDKFRFCERFLGASWRRKFTNWQRFFFWTRKFTNWQRWKFTNWQRSFQSDQPLSREAGAIDSEVGIGNKIVFGIFSLSPVWQLNRHPDWPGQSKEMQSVTAKTS